MTPASTASAVPPRTRVRGLVVAVAAALLTAGCGGSLTDDEVLAASGVLVDADDPTTGPAVPGESSAPPTSSLDGDAESANGPAATQPGVAATDGQRGTDPAPTEAGGDGLAACSGTPGETGPIVVASVGNYSGPAGVSQAGIPRGVQLWAASANKQGGVCGREVQVIVVDDGGDPARYASAVQDLVENRGVVAFVGNGASLSMDGGIDYLNRANVPVVGTDCSRVEWHQHPVFFPQCAPYESVVASVAHAAVVVGKQHNVGMVVCTEAAACTSLKDPFVRAVPEVGGEIVYSADISLTQIDFTAECRGAKEAGVEAMFVGADANTLLRWARSCARQNFFPQYVGLGVSVTEDIISERGLETMLSANPMFPFQGVSGGVFEEYDQAVKQFGDGAGGPAESNGWAAGKLFAHVAILAAQSSQSIRPDTLVAAAHTMKAETLGGLTVPLTFTGDTPQMPRCYFPVRGSDGGWTAPNGAEPVCF